MFSLFFLNTSKSVNIDMKEQEGKVSLMSSNCDSMFPAQRQPFVAGIYLLMSMDTVILPGKRGMFTACFLHSHVPGPNTYISVIG